MSQTKADFGSLTSASSGLRSVAADLEAIAQAAEQAIQAAGSSIAHADLKSALEHYLDMVRAAHRTLHEGVVRLGTFADATTHDLQQIDRELAADAAEGVKI